MRNGLLLITEITKKVRDIQWYSGANLYMYFGPVSVEWQAVVLCMCVCSPSAGGIERKLSSSLCLFCWSGDLKGQWKEGELENEGELQMEGRGEWVSNCWICEWVHVQAGVCKVCISILIKTEINCSLYINQYFI